MLVYQNKGMAAILVYKANPLGIPHSINYEETGTGEGLWDRLGRRNMTNMSFSTFSKPVALLSEAELTRAKLGALKTSKNDMFVMFRPPKRSHNPSLVPVSSQFMEWGIELYFYANTFFCFIEPIWPLVT